MVRIDATTGAATTVIQNGPSMNGNGVPAVAIDNGGSLYYVDFPNNRVRKLACSYSQPPTLSTYSGYYWAFGSEFTSCASQCSNIGKTCSIAGFNLLSNVASYNAAIAAAGWSQAAWPSGGPPFSGTVASTFNTDGPFPWIPAMQFETNGRDGPLTGNVYAYTCSGCPSASCDDDATSFQQHGHMFRICPCS